MHTHSHTRTYTHPDTHTPTQKHTHTYLTVEAVALPTCTPEGAPHAHQRASHMAREPHATCHMHTRGRATCHMNKCTPTKHTHTRTHLAVASKADADAADHNHALLPLWNGGIGGGAGGDHCLRLREVSCQREEGVRGFGKKNVLVYWTWGLCSLLYLGRC